MKKPKAPAAPDPTRIIQAQTQVIPSAVVLDPQGRALSAASNGSYTITQPGTHRVQLIAAANQTAGYTMRLSAAAADGYNVAVEKLIARAEALRPAPMPWKTTTRALGCPSLGRYREPLSFHFPE